MALCKLCIAAVAALTASFRARAQAPGGATSAGVSTYGKLICCILDLALCHTCMHICTRLEPFKLA